MIWPVMTGFEKTFGGSALWEFLRSLWIIRNLEACITFHDTVIIPLFDYCSAVWDVCGKTNRDYLDQLQRRAVSIIQGRKTKHREINRSLSWPS